MKAYIYHEGSTRKQQIEKALTSGGRYQIVCVTDDEYTPGEEWGCCPAARKPKYLHTFDAVAESMTKRFESLHQAESEGYKVNTERVKYYDTENGVVVFDAAKYEFKDGWDDSKVNEYVNDAFAKATGGIIASETFMNRID